MKRIFAVVVLMASMVAGSAQANTCDATVQEAAGFYVAVDSPEQGSVWIYEETNGLAGLQRDDEVCAAADSNPSDTVIF